MCNSAKILIVDDEKKMTDSLKQLLEQKGYCIQTSYSGIQAVELLKTGGIDVVLLDIVLPDISGFEVLEALKKNDPEIPVIIITGFASMDSAIQALREGAYDYLKKPFKHEELLKRVENALTQRRLESENKTIIDKLSASEERYQYLVQNSPDLIFTLDKEGRFNFINDPVTSILGYESETLIGKPYTKIIHSEYLEKAKYIFNERRTHCRDQSYKELRLKGNSDETNGDSREVIIELEAKGMYDRPVEEKGRVFLGTYGVGRDITARKRTEDELKLQKAYFQQLFENSPEAIVILDNQDRIINVNKSFERFFQYSSGECKGRYINDLIVPPEFVEEASELSRTALSMGVVQQETVRKCKDRSLADVLILGFPIQLDNTQIGVYGIYSDITEQKKAKQQIQNTLIKLREAMGGIISAMVSTVEARDPYTAGHQQRVADLSRAIAREMGLTRTEIDGIRMAGAIHDLGKIKIPAEILSNPGTITDIEFNLIKTHPKVGYDILKGIEFPWPVAQIVYQHHERLDGSGYPQGLHDKEIILEGKILTVADVVEAIASHRPYRPALGIGKALSTISEKRGLYYDPQAVDACIKLFGEKKFDFEGSGKNNFH